MRLRPGITRRVAPIGGGGAPFDPTTIAGMKGWWRADLGVTLDGSNNVSAWADQSGAGTTALSQSTGVLRPPFIASDLNGKPGIDFSGGNVQLGGVGLAPQLQDLFAVGGKTLYIVATVISSATNAGAAYSNEPLFASTNEYFGVYAQSTPQLRAYNWDGGENPSLAQAIVMGTGFVYKQTHDGVNLKSALNDGADVSVASGNTSVLDGRVLLGVNGATTYGHCKINEILAYNNLVSAPNQALILAYLRTRYGTF